MIVGMLTKTSMEIAGIFRAEAARQKRSQAWVGDAIGRHQTYAGDVLNGKKAPSTDEYIKLCVAFGLDPVSVMEEARERSQRSTQGGDSPKGTAVVG